MKNQIIITFRLKLYINTSIYLTRKFIINAVIELCEFNFNNVISSNNIMK